MRGLIDNVPLVTGPSVLGVAQVFVQLFGGAIATYMGWRWIFIFSIIIAILAMWLIKDTPESKAKQQVLLNLIYGLVIFIITMLALNLFITRGADLGLDKL